jgi:hypothetical protein
MVQLLSREIRLAAVRTAGGMYVRVMAQKCVCARFNA